MKIPKFPFKLPDIEISEFFRFSRREAVIIAAIVAVAVVLAVTVTVITIGAKNGGRERSHADAGQQPPDYSGRPSVDRPFLSDFMIQEDRLKDSLTGLVYYREPVDKWTPEMIDKYWIDPGIMAVEHLENETEKMIRDIFADVP